MDIAELRNRLNNIAAELAEQDVQQEDIAIEEEQIEEIEEPVAEEEVAEEEFAEEDDLEMAEEIEELPEEEVEETIEIPLEELNAIMQLAGFDGYKPVQEYANEPEEEYMDSEEQLVGLSGGLNGPKKAFAAAAGGDNPMNQEPTEIEEASEVQGIAELENALYKSYKDFLEEAEIKED